MMHAKVLCWFAKRAARSVIMAKSIYYIVLLARLTLMYYPRGIIIRLNPVFIIICIYVTFEIKTPSSSGSI